MRKINKAYKFRLYPNREQTELLAKHFGCSRFVYNYFLNQRREQYRLTGKSDNYYAQAKTLITLKNQKEPAIVKTICVDGTNIKSDTWYIIENGEMKECDK